MTAYTWPPPRVATYGTTYPAPGDTDQMVSNGTAMETRLNTLEAAGSGFYVTPNTKTASYTLVLTDDGKSIDVTSASAVTITVPPNSSVAFPTGTIISVASFGAAVVTIAAGAGVTILSYGSVFTLAGQNTGATLRKTATNTWHLTGELG